MTGLKYTYNYQNTYTEFCSVSYKKFKHQHQTGIEMPWDKTSKMKSGFWFLCIKTGRSMPSEDDGDWGKEKMRRMRGRESRTEMCGLGSERVMPLIRPEQLLLLQHFQRATAKPHSLWNIKRDSLNQTVRSSI